VTRSPPGLLVYFLHFNFYCNFIKRKVVENNILSILKEISRKSDHLNKSYGQKTEKCEKRGKIGKWTKIENIAIKWTSGVNLSEKSRFESFGRVGV